MRNEQRPCIEDQTDRDRKNHDDGKSPAEAAFDAAPQVRIGSGTVGTSRFIGRSNRGSGGRPGARGGPCSTISREMDQVLSPVPVDEASAVGVAFLLPGQSNRRQGAHQFSFVVRGKTPREDFKVVEQEFSGFVQPDGKGGFGESTGMWKHETRTVASVCRVEQTTVLDRGFQRVFRDFQRE